MVGTRTHPRGNFPETPVAKGSSARATTPSRSSSVARRSSSRPRAAAPSEWSHTPSNLTLVWLALSLPLVIWDTLYILGRPATMAGGWAHWPIWVPYALYAETDYVYGAPSMAARDGFGNAQGSINIVETAGYIVYLYLVLTYGVQKRGTGRGAPAAGFLGDLAKPRVVSGRPGAVAPVLGFAMAALTLSKTALYGLNEYFSGFKNVGHNSLPDLILLWIIPNGMWLVFPTYMCYIFYQEIVEGLENSTGIDSRKSR